MEHNLKLGRSGWALALDLEWRAWLLGYEYIPHWVYCLHLGPLVITVKHSNMVCMEDRYAKSN